MYLWGQVSKDCQTFQNGFELFFILVEIIPLGKESCINEFPAFQIVSLLADNQYSNVISKYMECRAKEQFFSLVSAQIRPILEPQLLPNFKVICLIANHIIWTVLLVGTILNASLTNSSSILGLVQ